MKRAMIGLLALPLLAGCSTLHHVLPDSLTMQRRVINQDIPVAQDLDTARTRKLFLLLVDGLRRQGKARAALAFLADYNREFPGDPKALRLQADCLLDTGDYARAAEVYRGLRDGPEAAAAYAGLGRVAAAGHDWPRAVAQFGEAVKRAPARAQYVNDLGFALVRTGRFRRGLARLEQATQLDPHSVVARNNLVLGLVLAGRAEDARRLVAAIDDPAQRREAALLLKVRAAANEPVGAPGEAGQREKTP